MASPPEQLDRPTGPAPLHAALLLSILSIAAFATTLRNDFAFDDRGFVDGTWLEIHRANPLFAFTSGSMEGSAHWGVAGYYRPIVTLSMVSDFSLWGRDPRGFHLTNILLHLGCTLLAHGVLRRLVPDGRVAFAAAALFAVHPAHAESVAFVSGRTDLLGALFLLLSVHLLPREGRSGASVAAWTGSLVAFALALLSKESAVCLPGLLAVLLILERGSVRAAARGLVPHGLLLGIYIVVRLVVLPEAGVVTSYATAGVGPAGRLGTMLPVGLGYLKTALVPVPLAVDRGVAWAAGLGGPRALASLGVYSAVGVALWRARAHRPLLHAAAWFALPLLPVANLIPTGTIQADRYLYLPVLGTTLLTAWAALSAPWRRGGAVLVAIVGLLYLGLAIDRSRDWRDDRSLWEANVADFPGSRLAVQNLGATLGERGDHAGAVAVLRRAVAAGMSDPVLHYNLGFALESVAAATPDPEAAARLRSEARTAYDLCVEAAPYPPALERLGFLRIAAGEIEEGAALLRRALPASEAAFLQLADLARDSGRAEEEIRLLEGLTRSHPGNGEGAFRLARIRVDRGETEAARAAYARLLEAPGVDPRLRDMALGALLALEEED